MKAAHFGTFDVENFGDLLFPLILERRLGDIVRDFVHASPRGGPPVWGDCVPTISTEALLRDPGDLGAAFVGGGNIVYFGATTLRDYDRGGQAALVAYPFLWLAPAYIAAQRRIPLVWNAPGVQHPVPPNAAGLVQWAASRADYLAVRDATSLSRLRDANVAAAIDIVPDTALEVSRLWTAAEIDTAYESAFRERGRQAPDRSIAFHLSKRFLTEDYVTIARRLDRICQQHALSPILVAIGPCHGDSDVQRAIGSRMETEPLVIDRPRSLREVAACIARSDVYAGSSLHGLITACSFGTRGVAVIPDAASTIRKFSGFLDPLGLTRWRCDSWQSAESALDEAQATSSAEWERVAASAAPALDRHWGRIRGILASAGQRADARTPSRDGRHATQRLREIERDLIPSHAAERGAMHDPVHRLSALVEAAAERRGEPHDRRAPVTAPRPGPRDSSEASPAAPAGRAAPRAAEPIARDRLALFGIVVVRNEADVIRLSILHHLELGFDRILVIDNGSTDGTAQILERLGRDDDRIRWRTEAGQYHQVELRTRLAREAAAQGADWVAPFDADEFWWIRSGDLRAKLSSTGAGALRAEVVNFVQRRDRLVGSEEGLLTMTRRPPRRIAENLPWLESGEVAYVELRYPGKWIFRATEGVVVASGNHSVSGVAGEAREAFDLVCLHAPLRSRTCLNRKAEHGLRVQQAGSPPDQSWHLKRWARLHAAGALDGEWAANSYVDEALDVYGRARPLVVDHRLRDVVRPFIATGSGPQREQGTHNGPRAEGAVAAGAPPDEALAGRPARSTAADAVDRGNGRAHAAGRGRSRGRWRNRPARGRTTITVIAWDVTQNPLGRAYLLADMLQTDYDVAVIGAKFPEYGSDVWEPLRSSELITRTFPGAAFPRHFRTMHEIAGETATDIVYVSKPRLPSLELGALVKMRRHCPLLLDIDDYELSFFPDRAPITLNELREGADGDVRCPHGNVWTRYCESIVHCVDGVTVSNESLQARYGGVVIPHARDEKLFDPSLYDRASVRAAYGLAPDDRVVMFLGTPRAHKGLLAVAQALTELGDPRYTLCVVGSFPDQAFRERLMAQLPTQLTILPDQPFHQLPKVLVAADVVPLLQDVGSETAAYQMPAKFTDALAMGIPIIATNVPPLRRAAERGLVNLLREDGVAATLDATFADYDAYKGKALENRKVFLEEYSYAATRPQLRQAIESLALHPQPLHPDLEALVDFHEATFLSPTPR